MTTASPNTVLPVTGLIGQPGASRRIDLALPVPEGLNLLLATVGEPLRLTGEVTGVVEGVLVRGLLRADVRLQCARCLEDIPSQIAADVVELFIDPLRGPELTPGGLTDEGYEITDDTIDLDTLVRDALVSAVPGQPLCDAACKGLCPMCGINRNEVECACQDTATDPRWAVLENLRSKPEGA